MTQPDHRGAPVERPESRRGCAVLVPLVSAWPRSGWPRAPPRPSPRRRHRPPTSRSGPESPSRGAPSTSSTPPPAVSDVRSRSGRCRRPSPSLPGAKDLLVTVKAQDQLVEVSTSTGKVVHRLGVGLEPDAVAVTAERDAGAGRQFRRRHGHPGPPGPFHGRRHRPGRAPAGGPRRSPRTGPGRSSPTTGTGR